MTIAVATLDVLQATLAETDSPTPQVSTEELRRILASGSALVLDSRKRAEFIAGHIAGAQNCAPDPGAPAEAFAAAVENLVAGDKSRPLVLYCNGQYCKAGRRLARQLVEAGFTAVRRYQLGIPVWRAFGGPVEIEVEGIARIYGVDRSAVYFDARSPAEFAQGSLAGAHNVPADGADETALEQAPLPRQDFNTRVAIFGRDGAQARRLADAIGRTPFQNVSYCPGTYAEIAAALAPR